MGVGGGLSAQLCIHYAPQKEPVKEGRVCIIQCSGWIIGYSWGDKGLLSNVVHHLGLKVTASCEVTLRVGSGVRDTHSWTLFTSCGQGSVSLIYSCETGWQRHQGLDNESTVFCFYRWYFQLKINTLQWAAGLRKVNLLLPWPIPCLSNKRVLHWGLQHTQLVQFFWRSTYLISSIAGGLKNKPTNPNQN